MEENTINNHKLHLILFWLAPGKFPWNSLNTFDECDGWAHSYYRNVVITVITKPLALFTTCNKSNRISMFYYCQEKETVLYFVFLFVGFSWFFFYFSSLCWTNSCWLDLPCALVDLPPLAYLLIFFLQLCNCSLCIVISHSWLSIIQPYICN